MDIAYMKNNYNDSNLITEDFMKENLGVSIPYLTILSICTVSGCFGNVLVIGSVTSYKVRQKYQILGGEAFSRCFGCLRAQGYERNILASPPHLSAKKVKINSIKTVKG